MAGIIIGIQPLKGTLYYEEYTNFKSYTTDIEGTQFKIRRDDYIWATDPKVKKLQELYLDRQADYIKEYITQNNIKHPNQAVLAPAHLYLVKEILEEIKSEKSSDIPNLENELYMKEGAGRNYKNSPLYNAYLSGQNDTRQKKPTLSKDRKFRGIKITTA